MAPPKDPVIDQVRVAAAEAALEDSAARRALGTPLPGPTKEAMAVCKDIPVGRWKVRPICDGDFEVLSELNHPICKLMALQFDMAYHGKEAGDTAGFEGYNPRGPSMWQLAWIMTRPARTVLAAMRGRGVAGLKTAAEDEFFEQPTALLVELYLAVAKQMSEYWSTTQGYGVSSNVNGEDAAAVAPENPTR